MSLYPFALLPFWPFALLYVCPFALLPFPLSKGPYEPKKCESEIMVVSNVKFRPTAAYVSNRSSAIILAFDIRSGTVVISHTFICHNKNIAWCLVSLLWINSHMFVWGIGFGLNKGVDKRENQRINADGGWPWIVWWLWLAPISSSNWNLNWPEPAFLNALNIIIIITTPSPPPSLSTLLSLLPLSSSSLYIDHHQTET